VDTYKLSGYNLPATMDLKKWGRVLLDKRNSKIISKTNSDIIYHVSIKGLTHEIILKNKNIKKDKNLKLIIFTDKNTDKNNLSSFIRTIGNHQYTFIDGKMILKTSIRKTRFLASIKTSKKLVNNFLTLDIETRDIKNKKTPYCICFYDGINASEFFIDSFKNHKDMIITALKSLLVRKYNNKVIYVHNLSDFDGILFFNLLSEIEGVKIKPIFKDGYFINIEVILGKVKIKFRDSLLMLPFSLRSIGTAFGVAQKDFFPILFPNFANLNYSGKVPAFKYFNRKISKEEYKEYCKEFKGKK